MYRFNWFRKLVHNTPTNQNEALFSQPIKQTRNLAHMTFPALFHRLHAIAVSANFFLEAISTTANIFSYITVYFKLRCIKPSRSGQSGQSWMKLLLMTQKTMYISNQKHHVIQPVPITRKLSRLKAREDILPFSNTRKRTPANSSHTYCHWFCASVIGWKA